MSPVLGLWSGALCTCQAELDNYLPLFLAGAGTQSEALNAGDKDFLLMAEVNRGG